MRNKQVINDLDNKKMDEQKAQILEGLKSIWSMVSHKLYSNQCNNDEAQAALHNEIIARINMMQEFYKVSNKTINQVLWLAETKNHFKHYFNDIFKIGDIVINPNIDIKMLVTIN